MAGKPPRRGEGRARRLHQFLGLTLGAVLALIGLAGTCLAFYPEIERATIGPLRQSPGARPASYEALYGRLSEVGPPRRGSWNIELPPGGGVITGRYSEPGVARRLVSIDPVTLEVVRDVRWGRTVSTVIYELHYHLLMGPNGATIVGIIAIALIALVVSGAILWWRSGRSIGTRLSYDRHGTSRRKAHDIHRLAGACGAVFLLIALMTGAALSLPQPVRATLGLFSPVAETPDPQSRPHPGMERIPLDRAITIAQQRLRAANIRWIKVPNNPDGTYALSF